MVVVVDLTDFQAACVRNLQHAHNDQSGNKVTIKHGAIASPVAAAFRDLLIAKQHEADIELTLIHCYPSNEEATSILKQAFSTKICKLEIKDICGTNVFRKMLDALFHPDSFHLISNSLTDLYLGDLHCNNHADAACAWMSRMTSVSKLTLVEFYDPWGNSSRFFARILQTKPCLLRSLRLKSCLVSSNMLRPLQQCPNLQDLDLEICMLCNSNCLNSLVQLKELALCPTALSTCDLPGVAGLLERSQLKVLKFGSGFKLHGNFVRKRFTQAANINTSLQRFESHDVSLNKSILPFLLRNYTNHVLLESESVPHSLWPRLLSQARKKKLAHDSTRETHHSIVYVLLREGGMFH